MVVKKSSYIEIKPNLQVMLQLVSCASQPVITEYTLNHWSQHCYLQDVWNNKSKLMDPTKHVEIGQSFH